MGRFLHDHPGAPSTRLQRIRAIRYHHETAGCPLVLERTGPGPGPGPATLWRRDGRLDARAAMGQQPRYRFPVGVRGRRDAFLILLAGELGMTRTHIRTLTPDQVRLGGDLTMVGGEAPRMGTGSEEVSGVCGTPLASSRQRPPGGPGPGGSTRTPRYSDGDTGRA